MNSKILAFSNIVASWLGRKTGCTLKERIPLLSVLDNSTIISKDGTLSSMIRIDGLMHLPDQVGFEDLAESMRRSLAPLLSSAGHSVEFSFSRNPDLSEAFFRRIKRERAQTADRLQLNIEELLSDQRHALTNRTVGESVLLTVFTYAGSPGRDYFLSETLARSKVGFLDENRPDYSLEGNEFERHDALVATLCRDLHTCGQRASILGASEYILEVKYALNPSLAGAYFRDFPDSAFWPHRSKDTPTKQASEPMTNHSGREEAGIPSFGLDLDHQLAQGPVLVMDSGLVSIAGGLISGFDLAIAPESPVSFNGLAETLGCGVEGIPWRCSFKLNAFGLKSHRYREQYARLFAFADPVRNRRLRAAYDALREIDGVSDTVVQLQVSFATWAPTGCETQLRKNAAILRHSVERWGACQVDAVSGDPVLTVLSTVPGLVTSSTAPVAAAPLSSTLALAPIARSASPWRFGDIMFRTTDGKIWPYRRGSTSQRSWVEIFVGASGSGKSVAMNAFNFGSLLSSFSQGAPDAPLPRIAICDIGGSSRGLVQIVRNSLPAERRDEAIFAKLRMLESHSINAFDTLLGFRKPLSGDRAFLVNFVSILCDCQTNELAGEMRGIIGAVVDLAYEFNSDGNNPKRYTKGLAKAVDMNLPELGLEIDDYTTWWEVVDALFLAGHPEEARIAQAHAVPSLPDLLDAGFSHRIVDLYGTVAAESGVRSFVDRLRISISEAIRDMPILTKPSVFQLGASRLVALDLEEVTSTVDSQDARKQSAVMYMLARQLMMRGWKMDEEEITAAVGSGGLPEFYATYHCSRLASEEGSPKLLCLDEYHRAGCIDGVRAQILQDIREGRKHNTRIALASQFPRDFDEEILGSASSVFVFEATSEGSLGWLSACFDLTKFEERVMARELTGPSREGVPVFVILRTRDGSYRHRLMLSLCPTELWAFSTTAEDVKLRERIFRRAGTERGLHVLARRFPSGSAKRELEQMVPSTRNSYSDGMSRESLDKIVEELLIMHE